ncbi:thioredoxin-disulfide reductase [Candidatus Collierbacteria bacterium RIFOXYB1_FULL_49_13]|uniref:Thioredoxin reductase n=1 Tax=Candidatus Collierbacteria bacterium RIFOXYB1_FULL_49_13 TaxID=1817728 RepID=A0A1F5FKL8_9BACT|nr:MAG: thioredoxin-disulfide reductase [Candidatus Collierbacteria bacterium RIFOXYB1_FULL_49_13]
MENKIRDVIIVGAGPAGYAAAIYTGRAKLDTLMLAGEQAGGQLMWTTEVENYPGFSDGILGPQLMDQMRAQAGRFGADILNVNVSKVDFSGEVKKLYVGDKLYEARVVIITTGAKARMLGIGEEKWLGRGLSTCAVCDAAFFKEKITAVVGGGDAAMEDAMALTKFSSKVYVIHRRNEFKASKIMQERVLRNPQIEVKWNTEILEIKGGDRIEAVRLKDSNTGVESELPLGGLFLAIGHLPVSELWTDALEVDEKGFLKTAMIWPEMSSNVHKSCAELWLHGFPTQTSQKGVFGAGDVVDFRYRQAATAAGMGVQAALDAEKYLTGVSSSW